MSRFTGKAARVPRPRTEVWERLYDMGRWQEYFDRLPQEIRSQAGDIRFTDDSIIINAPGVGEVALKRTEAQAPVRMTLEAEGAPVRMETILELTEPEADATEILPVIEVDVPAFARPFVAPKLQAAADKMGELLQTLFRA